ncbi:hypothetical protein DFH07DRAFT_794661 [Mycena maculata]|uniref:Yeast cell wall synthesis Kre9/Knh1-like N-terminal domain-containing protein n=1 Tax=Mycena maculata TaxID=230809 RepID=A0AAD7NYK1_9AGAR|nr:hypothetical protein DFH07DRAFT_794661 [Mycena maculata]
MFTPIVFAVLASSAAFLARAEVTPNEPAPGDSFNEGATCSIGWAGDATGSTAWANMSIELMTGSNNPMTHLSTVATGQDGTKDGTFTYTCPEVAPNSEIYFYQFTSCETTNITWTGRFTIAGTDGSSTPPTETEQSDGQTVSYGNGVLSDPSSAVAAPTCDNAAASSGSSSAGSAGSAGPATGGSSSVAGQTLAATTSASLTTKTASTATAANNASTSTGAASQSSGTSAAVAVGPIDTRMWPVVAALTTAAMAFTILL